MSRYPFFPAILFLFVLPGLVRAEERIYPEVEHGTGKLRYINDVPVFVASGSPEQIGEAYAKLVILPAEELMKRVPEFTRRMGVEKLFPMIVKSGDTLIRRMPEEYIREIDAAGKVAGVERAQCVFGNTMADFYKIAGCSTIIIDKDRSKTGGPILGRNFDWPPFDGIPEHSLVVVLKPEGKRAFATVVMPPVLGVFSGMNDAGLCVTMNEIQTAADGSPRVDTAGLPRLYIYRRVLEECTTVAEAEKLLRELKPTSATSLTVCDPNGGAVFEVSPRTFKVRNGEAGICLNTNHFRIDGLKTSTICFRYAELDRKRRASGDRKFGVKDVIEDLKSVHQKKWTMHSMVFEPADRKLHVTFSRNGDSATDFPFREVDLSKVFE